MEEKNYNQSYKKHQNIYFYISLSLLAFALITFLLGALNANNNFFEEPLYLLQVMTAFIYYHLVHVIWGVVLLILIIKRYKEKLINIKPIKTIIGILLSPVSFAILMGATLLIGLSSCGA